MSLIRNPKLRLSATGPNRTTTEHCLDETWMTGLGSLAGLHRVDKVDEGTIALTGELDNKCVVTVNDVTGRTFSVIKMGKKQVRGLCVLDRGTVLVVTKERRIELWDPLTRKPVDVLKIPGFDPCAVCRSAWDTILVANWSQNHPNSNKGQPQTEILELKATAKNLQCLDHRLTADISSVVSMDKSNRTVVMASFNDDVIMSLDYLTGDVMWKISEREYDGSRIRPHAISCDDDGFVYVADNGLQNCRVFFISPTGQVLNLILNITGWCDDITWINENSQLVVLYDKSGLAKQDISVYSITQQPKSQPIELDLTLI